MVRPRYKPFYGTDGYVISTGVSPNGTDKVTDGGVLDGGEVSRVKIGYGEDGAYTDVSLDDPLPVSEPASQKELLTSILVELRLLNLRFEEAFQTKLYAGDIDG